MNEKFINILSIHDQSYAIRFLDVVTVPIDLMLTVIAIITAVTAIKSLSTSNKQNELSTVPYLYLDIDEGNEQGERLLLRSGNKKFAYKFKIDNLIIIDKVHEGSHPRDWKIEKHTFSVKTDAKSLKRNFLSADNDKLYVEILINGEQVSDDESDFHTWKLRNSLVLKNGFWVFFRDAQNKQYFTVMTLKADGATHIQRSPTKYTFKWKLLRFLRFIRRQMYTIYYFVLINVGKYIH